ncbi:unnamed protein product [marine sediment metagenome]|uniref:ABC-2 type transporter domain-containing protein n=1 Tax=marine sediment metagenome TaxID=412755 RepID=X0Z9H0_9ZZZZ
MVYSAIYDPNEFIASFGDKDELVSSLDIPRNYNSTLIAVVIAAKVFILPYFLFTPSLISVILSADSFAGEKERKTMESLALLPVSKKELVVGKVLSVFIPAILLSFIFFAILCVEINLLAFRYLDGNILIITDLTFVLAIFILTPVFTFFNILVTIIVSSRSKNFKNAQTVSGLLIMPVLIIIFTQIFNPTFLSPVTIIIFSLFLGGLCVIILEFGYRYLSIEKLILVH